ncbi:hypothetical protein K438DRAFT_1830278 [Mycena galopus ATCC 62051]|nr:hypothetical protein K438DRAFT_1830278 [Mycena galopus ATCC 62051]
MKCLLSAIFISVAVGLTGALPQKRTCGDPGNAVPLYRSYNPTGVDHYYTADADHVNLYDSGWPLQQVAALVFVDQEESTVPFYHLYSRAAVDNYYTTSMTEVQAALNNGYVNVTNDPLTYIYPTQICGSAPFYKLYSASQTDNFYTTSESERLDFIANQGYVDVEIAGYVLPLTPSQCN